MTNDLKNQETVPTEHMGETGATESMPWLRWLRNTTIVGLSISLVIHLVLWAIAANILFSRTDASLGPGGVPEPVEFAVISQAELRELDDAADAAEAALPEAKLEPSESPDDFTLEPIDLAELTAPTSELSDQSPSDLGGGDVLDGELSGLPGSEGTGSGSGGGQGFFGIEAKGSRFAFVLDKSGSMRGGRFEALKLELMGALEGYDPTSSVFVVFYSDGEPLILGSRVRWRDATAENLTDIRRELEQVGVGGATRPIEALKAVERLRPRPEAIYLLTDGEFENPPEVVSESQRVSRRFGCPVHCVVLTRPIDLESQSATPAIAVMQRIAETTGGSFSVVEVP